jgi:hypothetical protein
MKMTVADEAGEGNERSGEQLEKIQLVEDAQLSFFIVLHVYGETYRLDVLVGPRENGTDGLKLALPFGSHTEWFELFDASSKKQRSKDFHSGRFGFILGKRPAKIALFFDKGNSYPKKAPGSSNPAGPERLLQT